MKNSFISFMCVLLLLLYTQGVKSQVTIGSGNAPKHFSILELDATNAKGGLRLPQIPTTIRDTISVTGNSAASGLTIYNTETNSLEYFDGTDWVQSAIEPWMESGSLNKATTNTQNIYQMGAVGIGTNSPSNKLHVFATADPLRIEGLQSGVRSDSLVFANVTGVLKRRSVHSLRQDIVAPPQVGETLFKGMLRFNTTNNLLEYYDGTNWTSIASNTFGGRNEGVVRIDGNNGVATNKPILTYSNAELNIFKNVNYTLPLARPFSYWPENIVGTPNDTHIVRSSGVNTAYIENGIIGQVHTWRIIGSFDNKPSGTGGFITIRLTNPISGFVLQQYIPCQTNTTTAEFTMSFITIADTASLPPPLGTGNGYLISVATDVRLNITIRSITRISSYKD